MPKSGTLGGSPDTDLPVGVDVDALVVVAEQQLVAVCVRQGDDRMRHDRTLRLRSTHTKHNTNTDVTTQITQTHNTNRSVSGRDGEELVHLVSQSLAAIE